MNYINYIFQIFRDYSGLQWQGPRLLSVKTKQTKKKTQQFLNFVSGSLP